jgi:amino acid transporter
VFGGTANQTGYSSLSIAWLIGLLQCQYAFCGFDLVYHISEEMPNAKRDGPRAAKLTIVVSAVIAWFTIVCVLFCVPDVDEVLNSILR